MAKNTMRAIKAVWNEDDIKRRLRVLDDFRSQIALRILPALDIKMIQSLTQSARLGSNPSDVVEVLAVYQEGQKSVASDWAQALEARLYQSDDLARHFHGETVAAICTLRSGETKMRKAMQFRCAPHSSLAKAESRDVSYMGYCILHSIYFRQMTGRLETVKPRHKETCELVFCNSLATQKPWSDFVQWLASGSGTYWICGKAGAGKSTRALIATVPAYPPYESNEVGESDKKDSASRLLKICEQFLKHCADPNAKLIGKFSTWEDILMHIWGFTDESAYMGPAAGVPRIFAIHTENRSIYIEMAYIQGDALDTAWAGLSTDDRNTIFADVKQYVSSLRELQPPAQDIVCSASHNPAYDCRIGFQFFGPMTHDEFHSLTRKHLLMGDVKAGALGREVATTHMGRYRTCFTHADLAPRNIIVRRGRLAAIIDWGFAGWYPEYWELTKAHYNFFSEDWEEYLSIALPAYDTELTAERTLWRMLPEPGTASTSFFRDGTSFEHKGSEPSEAWLAARTGCQLTDLWSLALALRN
ncbi:hypothetical protein ACHAQH_005153 [Verticillium albo-atrum]